MYGFDWQRAYEVKYIAKNLLVSQEYRKYNVINMKHRGNMVIKC